MPKTATTSNPVDVAVGSIVRVRRKELGISQADLGFALGITFQQVQKYERGVNRISASKLYAIAQVLDYPIEAFFEGVAPVEGAKSEAVSAVLRFPSKPYAAALAEAMERMEPARAKMILDLAVMG